MRNMRAMIGALLGLALVGTAASPAWSAPRASEVTVNVKAPDGVPASVLISGTDRALVSKPAEGTELSQTVELAAGSHDVSAPDVLWDGKRYVAETEPRITVNGDTDMDVTWSLAEGPQELRASDISDTSVTIAWDDPTDADATLVRTEGDHVPDNPDEGTVVDDTDRRAEDSSLEPGHLYTYTLFLDKDRTQHITLGTANPSATVNDPHVRADSAVFLDESARWHATDTDELVVEWPSDAPLAMLGRTVVLPSTDELLGGYLGRIVDIAPDGSTVTLAPTSVDSALAYLNVSIEDMSELPQTTEPVEPAPTEPEDTPRPPTPENHTPAAPTPGTDHSTPKPPRPRGLPNTGNALPASAFKGKCSKPKGAFSVAFENPTLGITERTKFSQMIDRRGEPKDNTLQFVIEFEATLKTSISAKVSSKCSQSLARTSWQFSMGGVPMMLKASPEASVKVEGAFTGSVESSVTAGVKGHVQPGDIGGQALEPRQQSTPSITVEGKTTLALKGSFTFGPGVGTSAAGAMAGVYGKLTLLEAQLQPVSPEIGQCTKVKIKRGMEVGAEASAWWGQLEEKASKEIWKDSQTFAEFYVPNGCNEPGYSPTPSPSPTDPPRPGEGPDSVDPADPSLGNADVNKVAFVIDEGRIGCVLIDGELSCTVVDNTWDLGKPKCEMGESDGVAVFNAKDPAFRAGCRTEAPQAFANKLAPDYTDWVRENHKLGRFVRFEPWGMVAELLPGGELRTDELRVIREGDSLIAIDRATGKMGRLSVDAVA